MPVFVLILNEYFSRFRRFQSTNDIALPSSNYQLTEPWLHFPNSDSVGVPNTGKAAGLIEVF